MVRSVSPFFIFWLFFSSFVSITLPLTTAVSCVFSCTERMTPLEEEEIGIKTIGKVTRIAVTNAKMVRYMVFDIVKFYILH